MICRSPSAKLFSDGGVGGFGFFFNDTAITDIFTLWLHDALRIGGLWGYDLLASSLRCWLA